MTFNLELWDMSTFFEGSNKDFNSFGSVAETAALFDFSLGSNPAKCGASPNGSVVKRARLFVDCSAWTEILNNGNFKK